MKTSQLAYYITKVTIAKSFFLNIAPENFTQPIVITINGRSLLISWEEPLVPNGIIRNYTITRTTSNNIPVTIATVNSRIFNYTDQGLNPFTNYNYTIIATNAGGSIETDTTSGTTGQALATGLTAPLTVPVNSTVIFVSSCDILYNGLQLDSTSFSTAFCNVVFKLVTFPSWKL